MRMALLDKYHHPYFIRSRVTEDPSRSSRLAACYMFSFYLPQYDTNKDLRMCPTMKI